MQQLIKSRRYRIWQLISLYWRSEKKFLAYTFLLSAILLTIFLVAMEVIFSYWLNYFYDALQRYDKNATLHLILIFCGLATVFIIVAVYRYYIAQLLAWRWRKWLTEQFVYRWLKKRDYYYLEFFDQRTDNPDQRIQEDVGSLVTMSLDLFLGLISAIATFFAFLYVLWSLSGILTIPLGPLGALHVQGYLVWVAIIYCFFGTLITFKIGYPLVNLNFEQQRREATFRFAAIDLRSHAESVALYNGELYQKNILHRTFYRVLQNWYAIILRQKLLLWFTAGFNQTAVLLPFLVALPNYFAKVFLLGGLIQSIRAFASIQDALAFFVNAYTQLANWRAVAQRLTTFLNHLQETDESVRKHNQVVRHENKVNKIRTKDLFIRTPQGEMLLKDVNEEFLHGTNYLIKGPSGVGKSTFLRTLANIWPYAAGEISMPEEKVMFLPQKPYMPMGTLAEAIAFPQAVTKHSLQQLKEILALCNLENFIPRLQETDHWSQQLSPGEQQRIAFARILLHQPKWVFLDESTSMLDIANETKMYQILKSALPHCSIISVGHRPSLTALHDEVVDMQDYA